MDELAAKLTEVMRSWMSVIGDAENLHSIGDRCECEGCVLVYGGGVCALLQKGASA